MGSAAHALTHGADTTVMPPSRALTNVNSAARSGAANEPIIRQIAEIRLIFPPIEFTSGRPCRRVTGRSRTPLAHKGLRAVGEGPRVRFRVAEGIGDARSGRRLGSCRNDGAGPATRHPRSRIVRRGWPGRGAVVTLAATVRATSRPAAPHREFATLRLKSRWHSRIRRASRIGPEPSRGAAGLRRRRVPNVRPGRWAVPIRCDPNPKTRSDLKPQKCRLRQYSGRSRHAALTCTDFSQLRS